MEIMLNKEPNMTEEDEVFITERSGKIGEGGFVEGGEQSNGITETASRTIHLERENVELKLRIKLQKEEIDSLKIGENK